MSSEDYVFVTAGVNSSTISHKQIQTPNQDIFKLLRTANPPKVVSDPICFFVIPIEVAAADLLAQM